jgi:hypothetical protein
MAPAQLPIEITWTRGGGQRAYRLSSHIDPEQLFFGCELPFPTGEPALVKFALPGSAAIISASVELGEKRAYFRALGPDDRMRIVSYFKERLGLP